MAVLPSEDDQFSLRDGLIRYKDRIWLPPEVDLISKLLDGFHTSPIGGHSGIPVILRRLKYLFYWKHIRAQVKYYVQECVVCQHAKPDRARYPGLLEPSPVPN
jgi:hypothetical protein